MSIEQAVDAELGIVSSPSDSSATDSTVNVTAPVAQEATVTTTSTVRKPRSQPLNPAIAQITALLESASLPATDDLAIAGAAFLAEAPRKNAKSDTKANLLIQALDAAIAAKAAKVTVRQLPGVGTTRGLIAYSGIASQSLADARTDVRYADGKMLRKLWDIFNPSDRVRGPFLIAKRNEPKAPNAGVRWYVRDMNPASYTVAADGSMTANGQIDFPFDTKAEATQAADAMFATLLDSPSVRKMSKVNREAHVAALTAAAIGRVAVNGTAR